jgi:hypothetical protein
MSEWSSTRVSGQEKNRERLIRDADSTAGAGSRFFLWL